MTDRPVLSPDENDERISDRIPFPLMNKNNPWDEYSIVRKLGRGSFGHVYEAVHKPTRHVVAVKQIALESSDSDSESHMQDLEEIQREIASLAHCQDCDRVTRYFGSFVKKYTLWVIMELMDGGSCLSLLKRAGPLPDEVTAVIAREIVLGLCYLHAQGIMHRDIKAANILLTRTGQVKLADFGVAAQLLHRESQRNTLVGSPYWMAPEVIRQSMYDGRADIWSLGITIMELATGRPPLSEYHPMRAMFLIPKATPPRLDTSNHHPGLVRFLDRCLVLKPHDRATAHQLQADPWIEGAGSTELVRDIIDKRGVPKQADTSVSLHDSSLLDTSILSEWDFNMSASDALGLDPERGVTEEAPAPSTAATVPSHTDSPPWPITPTMSPTREPHTPSNPHHHHVMPRNRMMESPTRSATNRTPHLPVPDTPARIQLALEQLAYLAGQDVSELAPVALVHQLHGLLSQLGRYTPEYLDMLVDILMDPTARGGDAPRIPAARSRLASLLFERWHEALRSRWDVLDA